MDNKEKVFRFIQVYQERYEMIPSQKEIGQACGISLVTVASILEALEQRGWIRRLGRKNRAIQLTRKVDMAGVDANPQLFEFYSFDAPVNV